MRGTAKRSGPTFAIRGAQAVKLAGAASDKTVIEAEPSPFRRLQKKKDPRGGGERQALRFKLGMGERNKEGKMLRTNLPRKGQEGGERKKKPRHVALGFVLAKSPAQSQVSAKGKAPQNDA